MKINLLFQIWTILAQSIDNSIIDFAHENLLAIISLRLAILLSIYYDKTWFSSLIFLRFSPICFFFSQNTMYYFMFLIFIFWFDSFLSYDSILFLYFIINVKKKKTLHIISKKKTIKQDFMKSQVQHFFTFILSCKFIVKRSLNNFPFFFKLHNRCKFRHVTYLLLNYVN